MISRSDANEAVRIYIGYGESNFPLEDSSRLAGRFGNDEYLQLEELAKKVFYDLNELKPDWSSHTLESAGKWARDLMLSSHPWLDEGALSAVEWAFTWWWR